MKKFMVALMAVVMVLVLSGCKAPWDNAPAKAEVGYTEEASCPDKGYTATITKVSDERAQVKITYDQGDVAASLKEEYDVTGLECSFEFPVEKWDNVADATRQGNLTTMGLK